MASIQPSITTLDVPVTRGKLRTRGNAVGTLLDNDADDRSFDLLREALRAEAVAQNVEPDNPWLSKAIRQCLDLYEVAYQEWCANKNDTIGYIHELVMPSGRRLRFGDARLLARVKHASSPTNRENI